MKDSKGIIYTLQFSVFFEFASKFAFPAILVALNSVEKYSLQQIGILLFIGDVVFGIVFPFKRFPRFLLLALAQVVCGSAVISLSYADSFIAFAVIQVACGLSQGSWMATGIREIEYNLAEDSSNKKLAVGILCLGILVPCAIHFTTGDGYKTWLLIIGISGIVFSLFSLVLHGKTRKLPKPEPIRFKGVATKLVANKLFILLTIAQALKGIATCGLYFLVLWLHLGGISKELTYAILATTVLSFLLASWCGMQLKLQQNRIGQLIVSHGGFMICSGLNVVLYQAITSEKGSDWAYYLAVCALNGFVSGWASFSFDIPSCLETMNTVQTTAVIFGVRNLVSSFGSLAIGILAATFESDTRTPHKSLSLSLLFVVTSCWGLLILLYVVAYPLSMRTKPIIETVVTTIEAKDLEAIQEQPTYPTIKEPIDSYDNQKAQAQKPMKVDTRELRSSSQSIELPDLSQLESEHLRKTENIIQGLIQLNILDKAASDRLLVNGKRKLTDNSQTTRITHSTSTVRSIMRSPASFDLGDESPDIPK